MVVTYYYLNGTQIDYEELESKDTLYLQSAGVNGLLNEVINFCNSRNIDKFVRVGIYLNTDDEEESEVYLSRIDIWDVGIFYTSYPMAKRDVVKITKSIEKSFRIAKDFK